MGVDVGETGPESLTRELGITPGIAELRNAAAGTPLYLVGGAVRDLLTGRPRGELDVVTEGELAELADRLGGAEASHDRFGTATLELAGIRIDLARARSETYPRPGALPEVAPATIDEDLARRDFTVNAMAIPLHEAPRLVDPFGGEADLGTRVLRVLHDRSFADDPTRALRAARYVARLGLELEDHTRELARRADLGTVSEDRVNAELARLAVEPNPERGVALLAELGLAGITPGAPDDVAAVSKVLEDPSWSSFVDAGRAIVAAARGDRAVRARELAETDLAAPSQAAELAEDKAPEDLAIARALGAEWLDRWLREWRLVRLEISGEDLIAAGVEQGPAVGRGLAAALRAKLDGEISGREGELEVALRAAGKPR